MNQVIYTRETASPPLVERFAHRPTLETYFDSIKDQDWRTSFSTIGISGLEQSATEHAQRFIRTIVQVKIKS